ncbi:uncharacterised protein [Saccharolobus solfataricus]|uniref:Uncharacterized protein n=1 Tax=Saccharolobus solfataricus TaxID=2287 RepID=A0A157T256_SACSO|nr:uncharacterised protein [Saccharolobus solfataricus]
MNRVQLSQRSSPIFPQPAQVAPTRLKQGTEEFLREKYFSEDRVNYLEADLAKSRLNFAGLVVFSCFICSSPPSYIQTFSTEILILSTFSVFHSSRFFTRKKRFPY